MCDGKILIIDYFYWHYPINFAINNKLSVSFILKRSNLIKYFRMLQRAHRKKNIDINCVDSLGRGALTISIDAEHLEMVELLVIMSVDTKDALLQAINAEFVEAVELLLEVCILFILALCFYLSRKLLIGIILLK